MPAVALRVQILRELALRLGSSQLELEQFYGLPTTVIQEVPNPKFTTKVPTKTKGWQKNSDARVLENLAKQTPIKPSDLPIQIIKLLIQYPKIGKSLTVRDEEALIRIATKRTEQAGLIMRDLLGLCREEPEESTFASFQQILNQSAFASSYAILLRKLLETDFTYEHALEHIQGALKNEYRDAIKEEMRTISEKISKGIHTQDDMQRYKELQSDLKSV
jgi:DNA primase